MQSPRGETELGQMGHPQPPDAWSDEPPPQKYTVPYGIGEAELKTTTTHTHTFQSVER